MQGVTAGRVPVLRVVRNDALPGAHFELAQACIDWPDGGASEGWGRDADLQLAGLKAIAEAVERHAYARLPAGAVEARATDLPAWIDPSALVRYEEAQHATPGFPFARFHPEQVRWWLPATPVDGGQATHVLADFVCLPRAFDAAYRARLVTWATSSGCATAASREEAVARATLELVERDAFMRHWLQQVPGRPLRQDSLPSWAALRLADLHAQGCRAGVQWLTLGVQPVVLAWAQHARRTFTSVGSACGFDAEEMLASALGELETLALARAEGVPAVDMPPADVRSPADHGALYATREHFRAADALLVPDSAGTHTFGEMAAGLPLHAGDLHDRLRQRGHAVHWVDLALPEAAQLVDGLPLYPVRALAPGLVPIAFGHGLQPLGMLDHVATGGRQVHPFC